MAPNSKKDVTDIEFVGTEESKLEKLVGPQAGPWKQIQIQKSFIHVVYGNLVVFGYFHLAALYGLYLGSTAGPAWSTIIFHCVTFVFALFGLTAGSHLWSYNAVKAKLLLQIILIIASYLTFQYSVLNNVRDHRLHHRYTDTDADPHNATRGIFFSHLGWLLVKKHPEVKRRGKFTDLRDVKANPVLMFPHKPFKQCFGREQVLDRL
ncbi:unnamed protein product [Pieris macdunnoughi]|uniref:Uncharacterized protein n=1 Tax=Pieris macdunnoughi TaxID=345717 RepID=A0A821PX41_9NEOP|nr:unnamed protein product [Pieris macdunnoughi]